MIDLDSFKLVNDIYGHGMGDKVLISVAKLLKNIFDEKDLIARIGGDEFIAFCHDLKVERVVEKKTKFLNEKITELAKDLMGENMNIPLGISIGAVFVPDSGNDFQELSQKADKSLYKVKQNGKHGCSVYSEVTQVETPENFSDITQILGEGNAARSAYQLEFEGFKIAYRWAVRLVAAYKKDVQLLTLTVDTDDEAVIDEILEILKFSLRVSDCFTRSGKNQILVLLPETKPNELNFMKLKLSAKIAATKSLSKYKVTFDVKLVG
jgi:diguanylate cyclase (GGDEF)-like protein